MMTLGGGSCASGVTLELYETRGDKGEGRGHEFNMKKQW